MNWQYFGYDVPPAISKPFLDANSRPITLGKFREQSNLVLLFSHGLECQSCRQLVEQFLARSQDLSFADAQVLVVQPSGAIKERALPFPLHLVWDSEGTVQGGFKSLMGQPVTQDEILLVILDRYGALQAACSVSHSEKADLVAETLEYLTFIAIQCPE
ncbi:MAG: hypothetical protein DDG58_01550 [Ardenticatenia bacterium]|jgi:peroxiredoxin|nr:MAG: hypothetical protein DDG58_01550 [Ardenticatenia bacterium]